MVQSGVVAPSNEVEREALARMSELPAETPVTVAGKTVVAGAPYASASARICRSVAIEGADAKLACRDGAEPTEDEPAVWFFAPSVAVGIAP